MSEIKRQRSRQGKENHGGELLLFKAARQISLLTRFVWSCVSGLNKHNRTILLEAFSLILQDKKALCSANARLKELRAAVTGMRAPSTDLFGFSSRKNFSSSYTSFGAQD